MRVISETEDRMTATPVAVMYGLAGPSQGSAELSTWRVLMQPDLSSPPHLVDHDQVWMPIAGTFSFTVDGETAKVSAGQAIVVPGGSVRYFHAVGGPAQALVCMRPGAMATMQESGVRYALPWTE